MLPIANRKTLEIPHGLAALAAVICLVLAFATDHASLQHERQADSANSQSSLQQNVEEARKDEAGQTQVRERRERRERHGNLSLIPWFPVPNGGRG